MVLAAAGHRAETPADVVSWARRRNSALVLLTLVGESQWQLLARLRDARVTLPLIVLIDAASAAQGVRAVRAGARSVLPRSISGEELRRTVTATMEGQAVVPAEVLASLAIAGPGDPTLVVSPDRIGWLRKLATGGTVAELAGQVGYSERAMFRLLTALYRDLGVSSRVEAIMLARDQGWI
jgi:DNA-binding NarL/FixJ family response regulator